MYGTLFVPLHAEANFLSSLLVDQVYADNASGFFSGSVSEGSNSQNIALLQAKVTPASVMQAKNKPKDQQADTATGASFVVYDNALVPSVGAMSGTGGTDFEEEVSIEDVSVYVVRKGDVLSQVAEMFGVSPNTILWANDMKKGDKLVEGDTLLILPISGLKHVVTKGQTLKGIASLYKVEVETITSFNGLNEGDALAVGDELIIPNGVRAEESDKPIKNLAASTAKDKQYYEKNPTKTLSGYFINPVPGYRKSQGIHDKNGVDLAIKTGTPIRAAAAGRVTLARIGYNGGFGNLVIISHPNGTETLYAHQSSIATTTGSQVSQGQVIGYVGSTGRSTGPHLHFEVHGARNPGADNSWAK